MRVAVVGAAGRMGSEVMRLMQEAGYEPAIKVDARGGEGMYTSLNESEIIPEVIIDFSYHTAIPEIMDYAVKNNVPVVTSTTGFTEDELAVIAKASEVIPVFRSANMSLGANVLCDLVRQTAARFENADIEIVETHHNMKADSPSGTALMLADAVKEVRPDAVYVCGRSGMHKREANEIGIHAVRRGGIVGTHEVIITTGTQSITLKHEAYTRTIFAEGALSAASYLIGKAPGMYNMKDLLKG
ncbi:MAG: 4-hydroxy-tetrahydrodipicolinate reductase [Ruminococcaceae bacterium]|nr:4-hydroxy-tetrahydrodipicolinate reductase [Oscillospiraceae bacterium]